MLEQKEECFSPAILNVLTVFLEALFRGVYQAGSHHDTKIFHAKKCKIMCHQIFIFHDIVTRQLEACHDFIRGNLPAWECSIRVFLKLKTIEKYPKVFKIVFTSTN